MNFWGISKNYQKGVPVSARDDTFQYRSQKFLKRHRQAVLIGTGIVVLMIGFALFYTWNITQERNLARLQAERAERERERTEEVTEFMVNLFETEKPQNSPNEEMTVRAAIDQGIERLENSDISPLIRAVILGSIAQIEINLGNFEKARNLLDQAMPIVLKFKGSLNRHESAIPISYGQLEYVLGNFDESERLFQIADSIFKANSLTETSDYRNLKFNMVGLYNEQNRYDEAQNTIQDLDPASFGHSEEEVKSKSNYYNYLAIAQKNLGNFQDAVSNYQRAITLRKEVFGENNPETATTMNNLANVYIELEENEKALEMAQRAYEIRMEVYGPDHYLTGSSLHALHRVNKNLKRYEEALDYAKKSYESNKNALGVGHIRAIIMLRNIADLLRLLNRYDEAQEYMQMAFESVEENYPDNDVLKGSLYHTNGRLYTDLDNFALAEKSFVQSIEFYKKEVGEIHRLVANVMLDYGAMEVERNNYEKASKLLDDTHAIFSELDEPSEEKISRLDTLLAEIKSAI